MECGLTLGSVDVHVQRTAKLSIVRDCIELYCTIALVGAIESERNCKFFDINEVLSFNFNFRCGANSEGLAS